jgi:hypothetical protein
LKIRKEVKKQMRNTAQILACLLLVFAMGFAIVPTIVPVGHAGPSPNWNPEADLNGDGIIDSLDLNIFGAAYGSQADP